MIKWDSGSHFAYPINRRSAYGAFTSRGWPTVLHGYLFCIFDLTMRTAFQAIRFHLIPPEGKDEPFRMNWLS